MNNPIDIDFSVRSSLYWLKIRDLSEWGIIKEQPAAIYVTLPGYSESLGYYLDKNTTTAFNSKQLKINCNEDCAECDKVPLPDGLYKIEIKGSPSTFKKESWYLKDDELRETIDKIYISKCKGNCTDDFSMKLVRLELKINTMEAMVRRGMINKASEMFEKVSKEVNKLLDCKTCD